MKDILLDDDFDLAAKDGDFVIGESLTQEVAINLSINQGNLKSAPLIGPDLTQKMKGVRQDLNTRKAVKVSLERDDKDYEEMKKFIHVNIQKD